MSCSTAASLSLDEAASALDSEVEAAIQESPKALMRGKTVITLARMNRLMVMRAAASSSPAPTPA